MSLAAVSKHLKVLESASLIRRERRGSFQIVRINPEPIRQAEEWLAFYEDFWNRCLDAMQAVLEEGKEGGKGNGGTHQTTDDKGHQSQTRTGV